MTWLDDLDPEEAKAWDDFVTYQREHTVGQMTDAAFIMSLVPGGEPDIKFAVELGLAIMLDKPILAIVMPGTPIPPKLVTVADWVVAADIDTDEGKARIAAIVQTVLEEIED